MRLTRLLQPLTFPVLLQEHVVYEMHGSISFGSLPILVGLR
jgi:hypothetical protein